MLYKFFQSLFNQPTPITDLQLLTYLHAAPWRAVRICPRTKKIVSDAEFSGNRGVCCMCGDVELMSTVSHAVIAPVKWHEEQAYQQHQIVALTERVNQAKP